MNVCTIIGGFGYLWQQNDKTMSLIFAKKCDNPKESDFFKFLAKTEHDRALSIKDSLDYLEDPQSWFGSKEHSNLDG